MKPMTKKGALALLWDGAILTLGTAVAAAAIFFFMLPSGVAVGSGSALAMVLSSFIPLPVSVLNFILNAVLLLLGFLLIGRSFGAKTVYTSLLLPVFLWIFEQVFPNFESLTGDQLLDVIAYILTVSVGMAILFSRDASAGGLDIVAKIMNKYLHMDLGSAYSVAGIAVALTSALRSDTKTVVLSILGTYFGGILVDHFMFGMNIKRRVCVISNRLDEVVRFLIDDLHSGATINEIIGAHSGERKREVIAIVDRAEYRRLMDYVCALDPAAFVTVYKVSEIRYVPKRK